MPPLQFGIGPATPTRLGRTLAIRQIHERSAVGSVAVNLRALVRPKVDAPKPRVKSSGRLSLDVRLNVPAAVVRHDADQVCVGIRAVSNPRVHVPIGRGGTERPDDADAERKPRPLTDDFASSYVCGRGRRVRLQDGWDIATCSGSSQIRTSRLRRASGGPGRVQPNGRDQPFRSAAESTHSQRARTDADRLEPVRAS